MLRRFLGAITRPATNSCPFGHRSFARAPPVTDRNPFAREVRELDRHSTQALASKRSTRRVVVNDAPAEDDFDPGRHEADFTQFAETHRTHRQELAHQRERIKQRTVRQRYFRTEQPNFLTWTEKAEIRRLHAQDPDEWSVERLSESFPASPDVLDKIVRSRWTPRDQKRIARHDEAVREAWTSLKAGEFDAEMEPALLAHLRKFSVRSAPASDTVPGQAPVKVLPQMQVNDDFSNILKSCAKYKLLEEAKPATDAEQSGLASLADQPVTESDTFILGKRAGRSKTMMYRELDVNADQANQAKPKANGHNPFQDPRTIGEDDDEDELYGDTRTTATTGAIAPATNDRLDGDVRSERRTDGAGSPADGSLIPNKFASGDLEANDAQLRKMSMPAIREHINIPAKVWRRGATYKLEDCYYDDDGEFLYRVPGMTGRKM